MSQKHLLDNKINNVESGLPDFGLYQTKAAAAISNQTLTDDLTAATTKIQQVKNDIPDVSSFVTQADINNSINNITVEYLPRNGGQLDGTFTLNKSDIADPGIDFSTSSSNSINAIKFAAYSPSGTSTATLGSTNNLWEYAWSFDENEDFCWIYNDTNKVFSITKDGPACSTLLLGDMTTNDSNGRVIVNKIDVKERLHMYKTAFEEMRQGVANATDFDSLKSNILTALASV